MGPASPQPPAPCPPEGGPPTAFLEASAVLYVCDRFFLSSSLDQGWHLTQG